MNPRSLHSRAVWVFGGVVAILTLCVGVVSFTVQHRSLLKLEAKGMQRELSRVDTAFRDALHDLEAVLRDDTGQSSFGVGGPQDVWLYSWKDEATGTELVRVPQGQQREGADLARLLDTEVSVLSGRIVPSPTARTVSGVIRLGGQPWLYAAMRSDSTEGPARIALRRLEAGPVAWLSERLFLDITLITDPLKSGDAGALRAASNQDPRIEAVSETKVSGYLPVRDLSDRQPILLRADDARTLYQQGLRQVYLLVFGVAAAGIVVGLAGWQIIDRWVVARVRVLKAQVGEITRGGDLHKRVTLDDTDELAELAASVNALLDRLEHRTGELAAEIGERVKVQERLSNANRELQATLQFRQDLSNMLVHDIRSPLTVIDFYLQIQARRMGADASSRDQSLSLATKSVNRLNLMINDLLIMAKFEAGKITLNRSLFDLRSTLVRNIDEMRFLAQKRNVTIVEAMPPEALMVELDSNLLWRVIENLLSNAVKYSPDEASITVRAESRSGLPGADSPANGDHVHITVTDEGPGIPEELHETIFEKFSIGRLDRSKLQIGLGLSFCRMIVEAQGGNIWVENNSPTGSIFHVELPAVVPVRATAEAQSA